MEVSRGHSCQGSAGTLTVRASGYPVRGFRELLHHHGHCLVQEYCPFPWGQDDKTQGSNTGLPSSTGRSPAESLGSSVVSPAVMWNVTDDIISVQSPGVIRGQSEVWPQRSLSRLTREGQVVHGNLQLPATWEDFLLWDCGSPAHTLHPGCVIFWALGGSHECVMSV